MTAELPLVERLRRLHPTERTALYDRLARIAGAVSDVRYDWQNFWARPDQLVDVADLDNYALIVFGGIRGTGKTRASVELFIREINAGRARYPRIVAATEYDVDKTVIHGPSGIMECMPPEERPRWLPSEGAAGVLRFQNGIDVLCYAAGKPEQLVGTAGDLDLMDDPAKWGSNTEIVWRHCRASCRLGRAVGIVATTRRGTTLLRKMLSPGEVEGVLVRRPTDVRANINNLTARLFKQLQAEMGDSDFWRQELEDEDISSSSPFAGLDFDKEPIRLLIAPRSAFAEVIVGVDPADGKGGDHDDWGVGAAGRRADGHVVALDDASGNYDDDEGADAALRLCEAWGATKIVVESNRGKRVLNALRAAYYRRELEAQRGGGKRPMPLPELIPVTARDGKRLRAGPLRALYLQGLLHHVPGLSALEKQQREWEPDGPKRPKQDDRIDWLVHAVHHLADLGREGGAGAWEQLEGLAERVRAMPAAAAAAGPTPDPRASGPVAGGGAWGGWGGSGPTSRNVL